MIDFIRARELPYTMIQKADRNDAQAIWDIRIAEIITQCCGSYSTEILDAWTDGVLTEHFSAAVAATLYVAVDGATVRRYHVRDQPSHLFSGFKSG